MLDDVKFTDQWGLYDVNWKHVGVMVEQSFTHPAKFSYRLVCHIVRRMLDEGWVKPGDVIGEPFGGIGSTGIVCSYHGLRSISVELEPKFHAIQLENLELNRHKWEALGAEPPVFLLGDSRRFCEIVGEHLAACATSPPYAKTLGSENGIDYSKCASRGRKDSTGRSALGQAYGNSEGNIGNLPAGELSAVATSPPFLDARQDTTRSGPTKGGGPCAERNHTAISDYGDTPGQIGKMPAGDVQGVVTSPPYAGNEKSDYRVRDDRGLDRDERRGFRQGQGCFRGSETFGQTDGQIGALPTGDIQGCVTSPPYAESITGDHSERETATESRAKRNTPGGSLGQSCRHGGYGASEGNIGNLSEGAIDATLTSPPFARSGTGSTKECNNRQVITTGTPTHKAGAKIGTTDYAASRHSLHNEHPYLSAAWLEKRKSDAMQQNLGDLPETAKDPEYPTYWSEMSKVYSQMLASLRPGGVAAVVLKDYVAKGQIVPLVEQSAQLLRHVGFDVFEITRCWMTKETAQPGLFGEPVVKKTKKVSFFRRLLEAKRPDLAIDYECVIWCRRPRCSSS